MSKKIIITITILLVIAMLGFTIVKVFDIKIPSKKQNDNKDSYFSKTMDIHKVESGDISNSISSEGKVSLSKSETMILPINVKINNVLIKSGAVIKEGDTVANLDIKSLKNERAEITAQLSKAKVELGKMDGYVDIKITAGISGTVTNNILSNRSYENILSSQKKIQQ